MLKNVFALLLACTLAACMQTAPYTEPVAKYESVTGYGMDPAHGLLAQVPTCLEPRLWRAARHQFNGAEQDYGTTGVLMGDVIAIRQQGAHVKYDGKVGRGWCEAFAGFSDNMARRVIVEIASGMGVAGADYGLHVCVDGLDIHKAYAPACRVLRRREF